MTSALPVALPYGMRDCKIYPYTDALGTSLATTGYDLPNMQTFQFSEAEEFTDLRGDDSLVATHGNGAEVDWSLEAGGIALEVWAVLTGGQIIESGAAPNRKIILRKTSEDQRPYFRVDGQIISDSGGDVVAIVYRAKCNKNIEGTFADGKFFVTSVSGVGLPMPGSKLLYDIIQNETRTYLSTTPTANPIMPPVDLVASKITDTEIDLTWEAVSGATGYSVQKSSDGETWSSAGTDPTTNSLSVSTLTAETKYYFRVATKVSGGTGDYSEAVSYTTLASDDG